MSTAQYDSVVISLLGQLPSRTKEVLERRYGLGGAKEPETLEEIGEDFGLTRERVRQIEVGGFTQLREEVGRAASAVIRDFERHLRAHGDLRAENDLFDDFSSQAQPQTLRFLFDLGEPFNRHRETDRRHTVWALEHQRVKDAEAFEKALASRLVALGKELDDAAFWTLVEEEAHRRRLALTAKARESWVGISRHVMQGPVGHWGLRDWSEIAPRNVGDWAFIGFRASGKPLHFTEIVERINQMRGAATKAAASSESVKKAHLQTVHNELIKDDRFVLVGRGLYALAEWGYEPGTVLDVIMKVLRNARKPLRREEIVAQVAAVRQVQRNTIVLNLQNRAAFSRTADGRYVLRRA